MKGTKRKKKKRKRTRTKGASQRKSHGKRTLSNSRSKCKGPEGECIWYVEKKGEQWSWGWRGRGEGVRRWAGSCRGLGTLSKDFGFYSESDVSRARGGFEHKGVRTGSDFL